MKNLTIIAALLVSAGLITSCSDNHLMQLKDGTTRVVQGTPQRDQATGIVVYTDENGNQQAVNQADIKEMSSLNN